MLRILILGFILFTSLVPEYGRSEISTSGSIGDQCTTPQNETGECRALSNCPALLEKVEESDTLSTSILKESRCGFDGQDALLCCPELSTRRPVGNFYQNPNQNRNPSNGRRPPLSQNRGGSSSGQCGKNKPVAPPISIDNKIVGGVNANLGEWPWIAALGYRSRTKSGLQWLCGGALVTNRHVVTAAHCVVIPQDKTLTVVRVGDLDLEDGLPDGASPVDVSVDQAIPHPSYKASGKTDDIAIVKLSSAVQFNDYIRPICLPTTSYFRSGSLSGERPYVAGWGALFYRGPSTKALQQVDVAITDEETCRSAYQSMSGAVIDSRVLCAAKPGKDACQGDSGGPLMLKRDNSYYLVGVVSYGKNCADPRYPGIYTKVSSFIDWINSNLN